jgi:hypothetical protein
MDTHATIDVLLETVFSIRSVHGGFKEDKWGNQVNENVRNIGKGEAGHRKDKRLKLGGGQAYDRSSV